MKLTMTNAGPSGGAPGINVAGELTAELRPDACSVHYNARAAGGEGRLSVLLPGAGRHGYMLTGSLAEFCEVVARLEAVLQAASATPPSLHLAAGHSGLVSAPAFDGGAAADMEAAALDLFRQHSSNPLSGDKAADWGAILDGWVVSNLRDGYGFTQWQVELYGTEAVALARVRWEREQRNGRATA